MGAIDALAQTLAARHSVAAVAAPENQRQHGKPLYSLPVAAVAAVAAEKTKPAEQKAKRPKRQTEGLPLADAWPDYIGEIDENARAVLDDLERLSDENARAVLADLERLSSEARAYVDRELAGAGIEKEGAAGSDGETVASATVDPFDGLPLDYWDRQFTARLLAFNPPDRQAYLLAEYRRHWIEARDTEPASHRKDNAGRRAANTWLREATGRY